MDECECGELIRSKELELEHAFIPTSSAPFASVWTRCP